MKHLSPISRPQLPSRGAISLMESVVMFVMGLTLGDWENYASVSENLRKFYEKTEEA